MYVLLRNKFWQSAFAVAMILLGSPLMLAAQVATPANDTSWPTFLGPSQDGKSNQKNILKDWSGGKLKLLWQHETGKGYGIGWPPMASFITSACTTTKRDSRVWTVSPESLIGRSNTNQITTICMGLMRDHERLQSLTEITSTPTASKASCTV